MSREITVEEFELWHGNIYEEQFFKPIQLKTQAPVLSKQEKYRLRLQEIHDQLPLDVPFSISEFAKKHNIGATQYGREVKPYIAQRGWTLEHVKRMYLIKTED